MSQQGGTNAVRILENRHHHRNQRPEYKRVFNSARILASLLASMGMCMQLPWMSGVRRCSHESSKTRTPLQTNYRHSRPTCWKTWGYRNAVPADSYSNFRKRAGAYRKRIEQPPSQSGRGAKGALDHMEAIEPLAREPCSRAFFQNLITVHFSLLTGQPNMR